MSLINLKTEDINNEYCYIKYADFNIIMCKKDEYLNMTKIVALDTTSGGQPKELKQWFRLANTSDIINAVEDEINGVGNIPSASYYLINNGEKQLHGTYCHKLLIPHILSWCSAKFAVKISKIVNMYYEHIGDVSIKNL